MKRIITLAAIVWAAYYVVGCVQIATHAADVVRGQACAEGCEYDSTITLPAPEHGYNARCSTDTSA